MKLGAIKSRFITAAEVLAKGTFREGLRPKGHWTIECFGPDGQLKWTDAIENLVVNVGLNDILDVYFASPRVTGTWYVGLTDGTPTVAAGDTMASHAGWVEVTAYSETTRQAYVPGSVSGQSVDNSASKAAFSINGSTTVGGAFLTDQPTKSGASGVIYAAGAFTGGDRALQNGDTLQVTATFTSADDGV